jgi:hypothetical protein
MKNRPVGDALFHVDGRTHMTKLTVAFRNSVNAPKNQFSPHCEHIPQYKDQTFNTF